MNDDVKDKPLNPNEIIVRVIPWGELEEELEMAMAELELEEALERGERIIN
jgi:hypothetical protein